MTYADLTETAEFLEQQIADSPADVRLALQPKLHKVLADMDAGGIKVPARLRQLDRDRKSVV